MTFQRPAQRIVAVALFALGLAALNAHGADLKQADHLLKQGQLERALQIVDEHLATEPRDARGRFLKGVIFSQQNKTDEAIRIFTDLTHEYPELPEPYNNLAVLQAGKGEYDKARMALEMAIRVRPEYSVAHENLGDIYAKMAGQAYDKAAKFDRANKTAPAKLKLVTELLASSRVR